MRTVTSISVLVATAFAAQGASVLDFTDAAFPNDWDPIPQTYGDNLAGTPNTTVEYLTLGYPGSTLLHWNSSYGDLDDVAFSQVNGALAELSLVPAPGYQVTLIGFDVAGWPTVDYPNSTVQVVDGANTVIWGGSGVTVHGAGPTHDHYAPNLTSTGPLRIQFGPNYNVGIDNVRFSESPIPEPSSYALLAGLGLVAFAGCRRFSR